MEILDIKSFKRTVDGRLVSITFETDGEPLEWIANTAALRGIVQQLAGIVWEAQRANPSEVLSIPTPSLFQARPTKNRDGVVIRFEMSNKLEYLFALGTSDATRFREQLDRSLSGQK